VPDSPLDAIRAIGYQGGCKAWWSAGLVPLALQRSSSTPPSMTEQVSAANSNWRCYVGRPNWVFSRNVLCLYLTIVCRAETFSIEQTSTGVRRRAWVFLRWIDAAVYSLSH
jgi:hypothetical protein